MKTEQLHVQHDQLKPFMETLLHEAYWCETQLCQVLDELKGKSSTDPLREAIIEHLTETQNQVGRLEKIFSLLGQSQDEIFCVGMQGLFDEAKQAVDETPEGSAIRDTALIIALQKIEHYEIVSYENLFTIAMSLRFLDVADLLEMNLAGEKKADDTLTRLCQNSIYQMVSRESEVLSGDSDGSETDSVDASSATYRNIHDERPTTPTAGGADALLYDAYDNPEIRNKNNW